LTRARSHARGARRIAPCSVRARFAFASKCELRHAIASPRSAAMLLAAEKDLAPAKFAH
jgi:hypothetical protein